MLLVQMSIEQIFATNAFFGFFSREPAGILTILNVFHSRVVNETRLGLNVLLNYFFRLAGARFKIF